jgi:hypothetical protein
MAWGKKEQVIAENAAIKQEVLMLRERVIELKEEKLALVKQLVNTQEALVAKEAPEAWRDQKYMEEQALIMANADPEKEKEQAEAKRLMELKANTTSNYLRGMEESLFVDADDMIEMFTRAAGVPVLDNHSLHGNDES